MDTAELPIGDDHPLNLELKSLRSAVERYQHEAHATSVKLQRHSLDTSHALERTQALETENTKLREELETLRANPDSTPHPAALQVPELTLALRKLSDKLTATEETLLTRTAELLHTRETLSQAHHDSSAARELANQARAREEAAKERERQMALRAKAAEEERKMTDFVVQEYADLVRSLQGQGHSHSRNPSATSQNGGSEEVSAPPTPADSLVEGRSGLQRLLSEFNGESEKLTSELHRMQGDIDSLTASLEVERKSSEEIRSQLAEALVQLDKCKADDTTATKMVSRYMKFSQSTTDALQKAMDTLRVRHSATTCTLNSQIEQFQKDLISERRETETLRRALDELSEDISRESYGRRREISLRLSFLSREENLAEHLRRWIRKSRELLARASDSSPSDSDSPIIITCGKIIKSAEGLLETLNGQPSLEENSSGSLARLIAAKDAVATLTQELQYETNRRLRAELQMAGVHATSDDVVKEKSTPLIVNGVTEESDVQVPHLNGQIERPSLSISTPMLATTSSSEPESSLTATPVASETLISPISPCGLDITQLPRETQQEITQAAQPSSPEAVPVQSIPPAEHKSDTLPNPLLNEPAASSFTGPTPVVREDLFVSPSLYKETSRTPPTIIVEESSSLPVIPDIVVASVEAEDTANTSTTTESSLVAVDYVPALVLPEPRVDTPFASKPLIEETSQHKAVTTTTADIPVSNVDLTTTMPSEVAPEPSCYSPSPTPPTSPPQASLIESLAKVKHRYDDLQRAFRDCHIALRDLKTDIDDLPSRDVTLVLKTAVGRLDDYNEDARVELEIRVSDEERIYAGYETLLSIPGAMSEEVDAEQMENDIRAFIDGTDPGVSRAMHQFSRKLDDLQHDIASLKQALHELQASEEESQASSANASPSWTSWTGGLLGSTRPASPTPSFGSVMTSPRLRHTSSLSQIRRAASEPTSSDPFAGLGLRIPMPTHLLASKLSAGAGGLRPQPRPRTVSSSAMYMLGFGARKPSFSAATPPTRTPLVHQAVTKVEEGSDTEGSENENSDVE